VSGTLVELRGLTKAYDGTRVVDGVDLVVAPGSLTALLGPSGCGKTTTLRIVAGLLDSDAGDVLFDGRSILDVPAERRPVAMVFQKPLLFPHLSVGDNVGFGLRMRGVAKAERVARVSRALELVRLSELAKRRVGELSGGQEQRAALARALVTEPSVLLLDEPFSALDASLRVEIRDLVRALQQELAVTTIFVTHDQEEAVGLSDHVALLLDGRVEQQGPPRDFYDRPLTRKVSRFFGGRNELRATVARGHVTSALGSWPVEHPDGTWLLSVRPEALSLSEEGVAATVLGARFLGTHIAIEVQIGDERLHLSAPPSTDVPPVLHLTVRPGSCSLLAP
jgi:ABC-type Fe3+/spermidine/putrescine transport system ATPase subunit